MKITYKNKYQALCDLIVGDSNYTHDEILTRCAQQVDALISVENKVVAHETIEVAICEECDSEKIHASKAVFWDKETGEWYCDPNADLYDTWCEFCEGECNVSYMTEKLLKVLQVTKRLKGESV